MQSRGHTNHPRRPISAVVPRKCRQRTNHDHTTSAACFPRILNATVNSSEILPPVKRPNSNSCKDAESLRFI